MSLALFKFLPTLNSTILATLTPAYNGLMAAGGTITTVVRRINALLTQRACKAAITATVTGGASSTATVNILSLSVTGSLMAAGEGLKMRVAGTITKPLSGTSTISFIVTIAGNPITVASFQPTGALSSAFFQIEIDMTLQGTGAGSNVTVAGYGYIVTSTTSLLNSLSGSTSITGGYNTTIAQTVSIGFAFSNSNASNSVSVTSANMSLT